MTSASRHAASCGSFVNSARKSACTSGVTACAMRRSPRRQNTASAPGSDWTRCGRTVDTQTSRRSRCISTITIWHGTKQTLADLVGRALVEKGGG